MNFIKLWLQRRKAKRMVPSTRQFVDLLNEHVRQIGRMVWYVLREKRKDWRYYYEKDNVTIVCFVEVLDGKHIDYPPREPNDG